MRDVSGLQDARTCEPLLCESLQERLDGLPLAIENLQLWTEQMMTLGGDIGKAAYGREMAKCEKQAFRKRAELRGKDSPGLSPFCV